MVVKLFVWDFHGVLEKDNEKAVIDISNKVLAEAGFTERFTNEDNNRFYGLKWYQFFENLLPELPNQEHLKLQLACFKYAEDHPNIVAGHVKPNDHAAEVIARIAQSNSEQIVISNTRPDDLLWFLNTVGLKDFFLNDNIIGVNAHQTHNSKLDALNDFLAGKQFDSIVVIGDSESDLELGRAVGAVTYFYKHPTRKHEETENADHIINDLRDILRELD